MGLLKERGIETEVFYGVQADPTLSTIEKGTAMLNAFQPDLIIAIAGGSPMDAAKMHCQCPGVDQYYSVQRHQPSHQANGIYC